MKKSYPPIFPNADFYDVAIEELESYFVNPFTTSSRRSVLAKNLHNYLIIISDILKTKNINAEVWVDGSFVTKKIDPDDVDLVFCFPDEINFLNENEQRKLSSYINGDFSKINYDCDSYLFLNGNKASRDYWEDFFQHDRDNNPKGVARIFI